MSDQAIPVVDLFAGPGGLGEGFSAVRGRGGSLGFRIQLSVEKEPSAHRTLRFRAFMRSAREKGVNLNLESFDPSSRSAEHELVAEHGKEAKRLWRDASAEALQVELGGSEADRTAVEVALDDVRSDSVLIGGPPCQAYSLVGRARNRGIADYVPEEDERHYLYREYVHILQGLKPAAFVMENVKGILSARVNEAGVFRKIVSDLREAGYTLVPFAPNGHGVQTSIEPDPYDFVIRAEEFGVPQSRHRVIVLGIRNDVAEGLERAEGQSLLELVPALFKTSAPPVPVRDVLDGLPALRSRLSRRSHDGTPWESVVRDQAELIAAIGNLEVYVGGTEQAELLRKRVMMAAGSLPDCHTAETTHPSSLSRSLPDELRSWLEGVGEKWLFNHEARGHMPSDLGRYLYAAAFAEVTGASPRAPDFPEELAPAHANWNSGKFTDRFRVQVYSAPGSTVTSHISKDGHYFIHPDPSQCRSLSVREAARIQTFPDDYIFLGKRTQQYVQVGNAVPPFLAYRIARVVHVLLASTRER